MNADELDALLDALPEPAAPPAPRPRHERLCEDSGVDAAPADGDAARAASLAISKRIAPPTAPTVPPLPHAQWERAREVAEKFWEKHQPAERVSKLFVDLPSSGIRVRAHRWGDFDDPHAARVLLLHDLAESGGGLCDLGTALASRGYAALAPDLRGHGDSDGNGDRRYALPALAGDLLGLVLELDLAREPAREHGKADALGECEPWQPARAHSGREVPPEARRADAGRGARGGGLAALPRANARLSVLLWAR